MNSRRPLPRVDGLLFFVLLFAAMSLTHHVHNAEFLAKYPNMPAWLSPAIVYSAWLAITAVGGLGYFLARSRYRLLGLAVLAVYGLSGFDGLAHYLLAEPAAHTLTMHTTIWLEVTTGALLLVALASIALRGGRHAA